MIRIVRLESFANELLAFVRATMEDGSFGWGQTSTYNADITAQVLHRQIAPWVLGRDASDFAGAVRIVEEREHKYPGSYRCRALAGLDTALWDWRGRAEGKPVSALLGGTRTALRAYASSMKRDITPQVEAERLVRLRDSHGFDAFKWRAHRPGRGKRCRPLDLRAGGACGRALRPDRLRGQREQRSNCSKPWQNFGKGFHFAPPLSGELPACRDRAGKLPQN